MPRAIWVGKKNTAKLKKKVNCLKAKCGLAWEYRMPESHRHKGSSCSLVRYSL